MTAKKARKVQNLILAYRDVQAIGSPPYALNFAVLRYFDQKHDPVNGKAAAQEMVTGIGEWIAALENLQDEIAQASQS